MATRKRRTTTTSRRRRTTTSTRKKGFSTNQLVKDAEMPALVAAGIFAGKFAYDALTKGEEVSGIGETADGKTAAGLLKPAILVGAGLIAPQFVSNKYAKPVGAGMAIYGGIAAAKSYTGTNVLGSLNPDKKFQLPVMGFSPRSRSVGRLNGMGNTARLNLPTPRPASSSVNSKYPGVSVL